jgi:hypothetical protein
MGSVLHMEPEQRRRAREASDITFIMVEQVIGDSNI